MSKDTDFAHFFEDGMKLKIIFEFNHRYRNTIWIGVDQIGRNGSGSFLYASTRTKPTVVGRGYETNLNSANTNANDAYCAMLNNQVQVLQSKCGSGQGNYQSGQKIQSVCQARYL